MRLAKGSFALVLALLAVAAGGAGSSAAAQTRSGKELAWPPPPAEPTLRLDGVVKKLTNFEVAVQGHADGALRRVDKLKRPYGVDFDDRGRLLVTDPRQGVLLRLDLDLGVALVFGTATTPTLKRPLGVASGPDGKIFVADGDLGLIVAFSSGGDVAATYGGGLAEPVDVALSNDGKRLFVADAKADSVSVFDVDSRRQVDTLGGPGKGAAEFNRPGAVEVDADGNLLVVDRLNARVQMFDSNGSFIRVLYSTSRSTFSRPSDVTVDDSGRVFVTDEAQSQVRVYDAGLEPMLEFGRNGLGDGEFLGVAGIAASGDRLAVVDHAGGRIQTFQLFGIEPEAVPATAATPTAPEPGPVVNEPDSEPEPEPQPEPAEVIDEVEQAPAPDASRAADRAPEASADFDVEVLLVELVRDWAAAWSAQDAERYLVFYSEDFLPANGMSREQWSTQRRQRIEAPESIEVGIEAAGVDLLDPDRAEVTFLQRYRSDRFADRVRKVLVLVREASGWKIAAETVLETL